MKYKIVMLAITGEDIIMAQDLTKEEAEERLKHYKEKDWVHYFEIKEDK